MIRSCPLGRTWVPLPGLGGKKLAGGWGQRTPKEGRRVAWAVPSGQAAGDTPWSRVMRGQRECGSWTQSPARLSPLRPPAQPPSAQAPSRAVGAGGEGGWAGLQRPPGGGGPQPLLPSSLRLWAQCRLTLRNAEPLLLPGDAGPGDTPDRARQQHLLLHQGPDCTGQWLHHRRG